MAHALVGNITQLTQVPAVNLVDLAVKRKLLLQAAKIIEENAAAVKESHTVPSRHGPGQGSWSFSSVADRKAKRDYDKWMRVARKLRKSAE